MRKKWHEVDEEEIKKLTLRDIKEKPRWKVIWSFFWQKKKMFPNLSDELVLEETKKEILALRQMSRMFGGK